MGKGNKIDHDKVQNLYDEGLTDLEISMEVGCVPATITTWRTRKGLKPNRSSTRRGKKIDYLEMERLYNEGKNDIEIAKILECSPSSVYFWRKQNDATSNEEVSRWIKEQVR